MSNGTQPDKRKVPPQGRGDRNRVPPPGKLGPPDLRRASRTVTFWLLLLLVAITFFNFLQSRRGQDQEISYSRFKELMNRPNLRSVTFVERQVTGTLVHPDTLIVKGKEVIYLNFRTNLPFDDPDLVNQLQAKRVEVKAQSPSIWGSFLLNSLPWVGLAVLWFFIFRQMQSGPKGVFTFGKSRARMMGEDKPKVTFNDVAGADEAKQELQEIIEFLKDPPRFQKLGGKIPKGALLLGPPGTGKTLMARAIAGEAGVPFFSMSGSDFVEMFVGVGASRVRDLFETGKRHAPCIIFIDELDAVGRHRGAGLGGGHDEREQTLNQLLVEMDGFESTEGVILVAATNRPDVLDPALLRPGRFDRQIVVDRPDLNGREGILKVHTRKIPLATDVDLKILARGTPGFSGADLANMVNEAALLAARYNRNKVTMQDFESAKDRVLMGLERKSMLISEEERKNTAYHEAGHVLVSKMIPGSDPIHKVTIIPRGRALGVTQQLPIDEKHNYSRTYCLDKLAFILGGRAAESVVLHELTTGSGNDIETATELARKMVCEWGMSDTLGPITFGKKEEEIFLGREIAKHRDYSEETAVAIDKEVRRIVEEANQQALSIINENLDKLQAIAEALLEREILDADEIDRLIRGERLQEKVQAGKQ